MSSLRSCVFALLSSVCLVRGFLYERTTAATSAVRWQSIIGQRVNVLEYKIAEIETNMATMTEHDNTLGVELIKVNSVISNMGELSLTRMHANTHINKHICTQA
jgi:hypothetical protein